MVPFDDTESCEGEAVCTNCLDSGSNYFYCVECEEWHNNERTQSVEIYNGNDICINCYNDNYRTCGECGEVFRSSEMEYDERSERYYCNYCYDKIDRAIRDYSYKPKPVYKTEHSEFYEDSDIEELLFGVELEVDKGDDPQELAERLTSGFEDVYCKHDGSLENGVEIVTHPCTLDYHKKKLGWEGICEEARNMDFLGQDANTCGLHIHVGRRQLKKLENLEGYCEGEATGKIVLLVDRHWDSLVKFSRRRESALSEWARRPEVSLEAENDTRLIQNARDAVDNSRYYAVNLQNARTIEFRMWNSTLKYTTILATLQMASNICKYAATHSVSEVLASQWKDICSVENSDELTAYLEGRGLVNVEDIKPWEMNRLVGHAEHNKIGEYHVGDIVRITASCPGASELNRRIGDLAIIAEIEPRCVLPLGLNFEGFTTNFESLHSLYHLREATGYWCDATCIERIAEDDLPQETHAFTLDETAIF